MQCHLDALLTALVRGFHSLFQQNNFVPLTTRVCCFSCTTPNLCSFICGVKALLVKVMRFYSMFDSSLAQKIIFVSFVLTLLCILSDRRSAPCQGSTLLTEQLSQSYSPPGFPSPS